LEIVELIVNIAFEVGWDGVRWGVEKEREKEGGVSLHGGRKGGEMRDEDVRVDSEGDGEGVFGLRGGGWGEGEGRMGLGCVGGMSGGWIEGEKSSFLRLERGRSGAVSYVREEQILG
jgi:hypothetical protein